MAPLNGIRILDLTRVLSGPYATQQLVDLGAEVIKIEHPQTGDDTRRFGPPFLFGESTYFMSVNRAKKSVAIDLKHERGEELARALAMRSDVVIENFRPGVADRLGLGAERLRSLSPSLITCAISGYGSGGVAELESASGYDAVIQASAGLMALTGSPHGEPTKVGVAIADLVSGLFAAQGILAALFERTRTGVGRHIEISMQDSVAALLTYQAGIFFATGHSPARMGNAHPSIAPYETVETKDGLYALAIGNDAQFRRFAHLIGAPWLAEDERFKSNAARVAHRDSLMAVLTPKLREHTRVEWDEAFREHGIPGGPVLDVPQALTHPQLVARGSLLTHHHPTAGPFQTVASPVRLDHQRPAPSPPSPRLGEHTREVLQSLLGLGESALAELFALKVLSEPS